MAELRRYLMRFLDGPLADTVITVAGPWPLADDLVPDGSPFSIPAHYRKIGQSKLTEDLPGVIRGAEYRVVVEERCDFESSVSAQRCLLPAGHPPDDVTRFHRFAPPGGPHV